MITKIEIILFIHNFVTMGKYMHHSSIGIGQELYEKWEHAMLHF